MLNINNSKNGGPVAVVAGGAEGEAIQQVTASSSGNSQNQNTVGTSAAVEILQNNSLRKSMQGSTGGLRQLQSTMNTQNQFEQQIGSNGNVRQSHSHNSHANGAAPNQQSSNVHQQYHSVAAQSRAQQQQLGLYSGGTNGAQKQGNAVSMSGNYGAQALQNAPPQVQTAPGQASGQPPMKYQNHGMMGVGAHNSLMNNHKQFSMSTQQGLFPKITNLRVDNNQSVPSSAHSANHGPQVQAQMNVLKHSGGHISGMSTHHAQQNLNHPMHYRGMQNTTGAIGYQNTMNMTGAQPTKPFSSPRSSQQHNPHSLVDNAQNDPNFIYQQQLQWKTKSSMNGGPSKESENQGNDQQSPLTMPASGSTAQTVFDQQRAKQISSGSEKRLKLQQQRQYYSEQYRVQQQRQHQQTANAVLNQNGTSSGQGPAAPGTEQLLNQGNASNTNYRLNVGIQPGREAGAALRSAEYNGQNGQRTTGQQAPNAQQVVQAMTPQIYSQQKQRHTLAMLPGSTLHNTQLLNGQIPMGTQIPTTQKAPQLSSTMNQSQPPYQQSGNTQVFFKKRASSNTNSQHQNMLQSPSKAEAPASSTSQQPEGAAQNATGNPGLSSPKNKESTQSAVQQSVAGQSTSASGSGQRASHQSNSTNATQSTTQQSSSQQQTQPKIPVICGFHKRILLITCQGQSQAQNGQMPNGAGQHNGLGINPNSSMSQARRIRNKNPNCNHNSNSVFYQPHYNNVKYDDSHKKKEDVLRKVFFKECAKEEEKRLYNGSTMFPNGQFPGGQAPGQNGIYAGPSEMARQQAFSQANDPNKHLQIIERILCEYLFVSQPFDRSQKQQLSNTQSLMMELGLDRALTPHRAFLLALIRAGKFNADNMLKVLSEVKTSATEFDNECIYCKYSQYALKESAKLLQKHQQALQEQSQTNPQQALAQQQQIQQNGGIIKGPSGEDIRIENLVRMFQSQLFKKSFINTSLMIIQRKMTEKYFQKYHNAKQAQQAAANGQETRGANGQIVQYGPDGKPLEPVKRPAKKIKPKNTQNLTSLEYLSKEIQKLAKNLANPKDKERYLELKEKYYREFLIKILKSNGVEKAIFPNATFTPYKYYIGRGNNSGIVRTALKSRFWWSMGDYDDWEDYNFIWTQWKSNKILNCIKSYKEAQDSEQKEQDKKKSSQSTRAGGHIDSQLSTQATDKESTSSKENLINTPKKNKLASSTLGNTSSELAFRKQNSATNNNSANKKIVGRGKKAEDKEEEKEENHTSHHTLIYGKMENNYHLSNKKAIYYNMKVYYEAIGSEYYNHLPLTYHIKEGLNDPQFQKFEQLFHDSQDSSKETVLTKQLPKFGTSLWIVKPGENTNRGCGIQVSKDLDQIKGLVSNTNLNGNKRSYIIQKYIERPLLYKNRKFDIRCFSLMCSINGNLQGYWYSEGYLRTSCREFTLKNVSNRYVHLTNDAVQKKLDDYGKFESGNKLSYIEFQKYLDSVNIKCDFVKDVVPKMRQQTQDSMKAVSRKIDPARKSHSFEIYGYDFMIDEDMNVWMIEVNTNPCFELSSPYLARLIPAMVENALKIAVDPVFPPPPVPNSKKHTLPDAQDNKFDLIFNEREDATELKNLPIDDNMNGIIEEEEMEEEGSDIEEEEHADE